MRVHANKKAIRALGIAESFRKDARFSVLAGVVIRSDLVVDGFVYGRATVKGDDSTKQIISMVSRLHRNDVNLIMLQGCVISLYNIVDVDELSETTQIPVICLTFGESSGIEGTIRLRFPNEHQKKVESYRKLGARTRVVLETGHSVYVRTCNIDESSALKVLNLFTLQGSLPEPVRVAKLLARAYARAAGP